MPVVIKEDVLRLEVTVGDALRMEVADAGKDLLEATLDLARGHVALLDRSVEVAATAELHDLTPFLALVLNEVDGLDDIDVVQR